MNAAKPQVCVVGCFQNGKSTLVNCLLDDKVARTGEGCSTTHIKTAYTYGQIQKGELQLREGGTAPCKMKDFVAGKFEDAAAIKGAIVSLWKPLLSEVDIVDTPGFSANDNDTEVAKASLDGADYAFVVMKNSGLSEPEKIVLREVATRKLPCSVLMNCWDSGGPAYWNPESKPNDMIADEVSAQLANMGLDSLCRPIAADVKVWRCNLMWFWWASGHLEDRETPDEVAACREKLELHFKKVGMPPADELAEMSKVVPVREYFQRSAWHLLVHGAGHARVAVQQAVDRWMHGVELAIKEAQAQFAGTGGVK